MDTIKNHPTLLKSKIFDITWSAFFAVLFAMLCVIDIMAQDWFAILTGALSIGFIVISIFSYISYKRAYEGCVIYDRLERSAANQKRVREIANAKEKYEKTGKFEDWVYFNNLRQYDEYMFAQEIREELNAKDKTEKALKK